MTTKIEDAKSVIDDDEVEKTLDLKSLVDDVLVIKAKPKNQDAEDTQEGDEGANSDAEDKAEGDEPDKKGKKKNPFVKESIVVSTSESAVEKSFAALVERIATLKSQGLTGDTALAETQKSFEDLANVIKAEFTVPPSPEELAKQNMAEIVRSALSEMLPQALAQIAPSQGELATLRSELAELRALTQSPKLIRKEESPQPRGLNASLVQKAAIEKVLNKKKDQAQSIAEASVGLYQ